MDGQDQGAAVAGELDFMADSGGGRNAAAGRSAMWSLLAARQDRGQPGASDKVVIALAGALHPAAATREPPAVREGEQPDGPSSVTCLTFDLIWKFLVFLPSHDRHQRGGCPYTLTLPTLSPSGGPPFWFLDL